MRVYPIIKCTEENIADRYASQIGSNYVYTGEEGSPWLVTGTIKQSDKFWDYLGENPYLCSQPGVIKFNKPELKITA